MANDINNYVGIPWVKGGYSRDGADCWGLFLLVLSEYFNIELDIHKGSKAEDAEFRGLVDLEKNSDRWVLTDKPEPGAAVLMYKHHPSHIGIYIGENQILHS